MRRGYRLQAENENDLLGWLEAIKSGTILALQKSASGMSNPAKSISKEFGLTKETGHEDLIHSILSVNQIELSLSATKKEEIYEVGGNKVCADCRSKGKHLWTYKIHKYIDANVYNIITFIMHTNMYKIVIFIFYSVMLWLLL